MNERIKDKLNLIFYTSLIIALIFTIVGNITRPWTLVLLSIALIFLLITRHSLLYETERYKNIDRLLLLLELLLAFFANTLDNGISSSVYLYVIGADMAVSCSLRFGLLSNTLCFIAYIASLYVKLGNPSALEVISKAALGSAGFVIFFLVIYVLRYVMNQHATIEKTVKQLSIKTMEQDMTLKSLRDAYERLEEMTVLKERNRMAKEIHDTVGHTLTTALVEMEAAKVLVDKDIHLAVEKFTLAQEQMRKGLKDIRESVRVLTEGKELMDLKHAMETLLDETAKHTGITFRADIEPIYDLDDPVKKTLFGALQEGLTNSIKHGHSTAFVFKLFTKDSTILFVLQDNGIGCSHLVPGFGLKTMHERVKAIGGMMDTESEIEGGFSLMITVPKKQR